jgi:phenylpyruvate tautomerase PptA (4-oxalocrotonate tautomerase family)
MPQLILNFIDIPIPETCLWEQLDDEQKRIVIETLTRLLVKATRDDHQERTND